MTHCERTILAIIRQMSGRACAEVSAALAQAAMDADFSSHRIGEGGPIDWDGLSDEEKERKGKEDREVEDTLETLS